MAETPKRVWSNKKIVRQGKKQVWLKNDELKTYGKSWEEIDADKPLEVYGNEWKELDGSDELEVYGNSEEEIGTVDDYTGGGDKVKATFKNWNGRVLKTQKVEPGETPTAPANPTRPSDAQYNYTFTGWLPEVGPITEDTEYIAQYEATPIPPTPTGEVTDVVLSNLNPEGVNTIYNTRGMGCTIQVTPYTASNVQVSIVSSDPTVVEVGEIYYDQEPTEYSVGGVNLRGVGLGECTITITSLDNPSVSKTYSFSVQADVPVTAITGVSTATTTAYTGAAGVIFDAYYTPSNAVAPQEDIVCTLKEGETDIGNIYCMSSKLGVAHMGMWLNSDVVVGTTSVYELFSNHAPENKTEITITVAEGIENFNMAPQNITINGAADISNEFTYQPTTADINSIQVWTLDSAVATAELVKTVDGSGYVKVEGHSAGTTTVIVGKEYSTQFNTFEVTVEAPSMHVLTFTPWDETNNQEGGGTVSQTTAYAPIGAVLFVNGSDSTDAEIWDKNPNEYPEAQKLMSITETADTGYIEDGLYNYNETTQEWDYHYAEFLPITGNMQLRYYFKINQ